MESMRTNRRRITQAMGLAGFVFGATQVAAASAVSTELLMFEERGCLWCERWNAEIGVVYQRTDEGHQAPLRRVDIRTKLAPTIELRSRPRYTPTFVLIHGGREVGRIEGYPGEDFFWGLLDQLLAQLPAVETP